jgi:hypothetical protein
MNQADRATNRTHHAPPDSAIELPAEVIILVFSGTHYAPPDGAVEPSSIKFGGKENFSGF